MKSAPRAPAPRIHPMDCPCRSCRPAPAPACQHEGDRIAAHVFAGIAVGLLIAAIIDRAIGGPGLLAAFGF